MDNITLGNWMGSSAQGMINKGDGIGGHITRKARKCLSSASSHADRGCFCTGTLPSFKETDRSEHTARSSPKAFAFAQGRVPRVCPSATGAPFCADQNT